MHLKICENCNICLPYQFQSCMLMLLINTTITYQNMCDKPFIHLNIIVSDHGVITLENSGAHGRIKTAWPAWIMTSFHNDGINTGNHCRFFQKVRLYAVTLYSCGSIAIIFQYILRPKMWAYQDPLSPGNEKIRQYW